MGEPFCRRGCVATLAAAGFQSSKSKEARTHLRQNAAMRQVDPPYLRHKSIWVFQRMVMTDAFCDRVSESIHSNLLSGSPSLPV